MSSTGIPSARQGYRCYYEEEEEEEEEEEDEEDSLVRVIESYTVLCTYVHRYVLYIKSILRQPDLTGLRDGVCLFLVDMERWPDKCKAKQLPKCETVHPKRRYVCVNRRNNLIFI